MVLAALALTACGSSQSTSATASRPATSASPSATSSTSAASSAGVPLACAGGRLALGYEGTDGATGHLEVLLTLANGGADRCTVQGYPGVRLAGAGGRALPMHDQLGGGFFADTLGAPHPVTLAPGARARFGVSFPTNREYAGAHVCRPATAATVLGPGEGARWQRVTLPAATRITPCGDELVISPLR
jgi:hypothetical protein